LGDWKTGEEMTSQEEVAGGSSTDSVAPVPVDLLQFDSLNPRLPIEMHGASQSDLLEFVEATYDPIEVGRSIAKHGYFASEPLITVIQDGRHIVIEGNRRLAALQLLINPELARGLDSDDADEWKTLSQSQFVPRSVPVVNADSRRSIAPILGFRHISGIEPWDPWAKARFVAWLVEDEQLEFEAAAIEVGESTNEIRTIYRNYAVLQQVDSNYGIPVERAVSRFGVFTRAMSSEPLREFIGVPRPSEVIRGMDYIPGDRSEDVRRLLTWLFGSENESAVIGESRHITMLGKVVATETGRSVLEETGDIEEAYIAAGGILERLVTRLRTAGNALENAAADLPNYSDDSDVIAEIRRCKAALEHLLEQTGEGAVWS
jgi:hypothetical protein